MNFQHLVILFFLTVNVLAFFAMGVDKSRARRRAWRLSERTFFMLALLGGTPGSLLGMRVFHHKTRHAAFAVGFPILLLLQLTLVGSLFLIGKEF